VAVLVGNIWEHGLMVSAVARAYRGSLGAEPSAGSRGRALGQEVRRQKPWSWSTFGFLPVF